MLRYLAKRTFSGLVALFLFVTFMFFVAQIIIPGDFTTQFALTMNREAREELKEDLGIDRPIWEQYVKWISRFFQGSFGSSLYGPQVLDVLGGMLPYTLLVFFVGTLIAFQLGLWLGKWVAWRGSSFLSGAATLSAIGLYTSFPPWLAFLLTYFVASRVNWLSSTFTGAPSALMPRSSLSSFAKLLDRDLWLASAMSPQRVMIYMVLTFLGAWLVLAVLSRMIKRTLGRQLPVLIEFALFAIALVASWHLFGFGRHALDILTVAGPPLLVYVLLSFGETMLIMRTSMMDTTQEEYITTARAKGLPERMVRDKHAARNALLPVLSRLVVSLPYLVTGVVFIEIVLDWPGLSRSLFSAMYNQDIPVVMAALFLIGLVSVLARLALDILYAYLDPRIRYESGNIGRVA